MKGYSVAKLTELLSSEDNFVRMKAISYLGNHIHEDYKKISELLLAQMNDPINFSEIRFGIPSGWVYVIVLIESLDKKEYPLLLQKFQLWNDAEKKRAF